MIRRFRDRLDTHYVFGPWWFHFHIVIHPAMWAGSLYINRKLIWLRPIDYKKVEDYEKRN